MNMLMWFYGIYMVNIQNSQTLWSKLLSVDRRCSQK